MDSSAQHLSGIESLPEKFHRVLEKMARARPFAKHIHLSELIEICRRLLSTPEGIPTLYAAIDELDQAGIFYQSDWQDPRLLQSQLTPQTFASHNQQLVILECLSELRWLALAKGDYTLEGVSREQAQKFIREVLALNLDLVFRHTDESTRRRNLTPVYNLFDFLIAEIGFSDILEEVVNEVWRILKQRPLHNRQIMTMITQLSICMNDPDLSTPRGAEGLVSALFGPTASTQSDPGLAYYRETLQKLDAPSLQQEAVSFARAMHETGLVSAYHAVYLHYALSQGNTDLLMQALGLSSTATDVYLTYRELINRLIIEAITPDTAQAVYGLACMLERGILYDPPLAPNLWRLIMNELHPETENRLATVFGTGQSPKTLLLAGVLQLLGLPFGIGQGDNPTCQAARAISMWSYSDPNYLMQLIAWAARDQEITMHFEGMSICSKDLYLESTDTLHTDLDAVSLLLVPHLDRIYHEMGRLCIGRLEDPHRWVNPEFHGWWVNRGFAIAVDIHTGKLYNHEQFIRDFYAVYHPYYNGNKPVIYPQPAGIAVTDSAARYVGWHAITIIRVSLDNEGQMRLYFFNPNNDSGQDWGNGVIVSTEGHGELHGQASLPFEEFASRLYIFHYDPLEKGDSSLVKNEDVAKVSTLARESWAKDR